MREVEAAEDKLSLRHTRKWLAPANTDARPTMHAMSARGKKVGVTMFPATQSKSIAPAVSDDFPLLPTI